MSARHPAGAVALVLAFELAATAPAAAQAVSDGATDEQVFEQVFHHSAHTGRIPLLLIVDGEEQGMVLVGRSDADDELVLPAGPVLAALEPVLLTEVWTALAATANAGQLSERELRSRGIDIAEYSSRLELRLGVPPALTRRRSHSLQTTGAPAEAADARPPSSFAGYLNLRGYGAASWWPGEGRAGRDPFHLAAEGALDLHGWVLEGTADVGARDAPVQRGDLLVSHDAPERALRFAAGDFTLPAQGIVSGLPLLGLGLARNFTLQPYRVVQPVSRLDFVLERPSRVTVLVNGMAVTTLTLAAGRHDLRDLPLGAGVNDIELVIVDDRAGERRLVFTSINPATLLAPGISQFSLALGFPRVDDGDARRYRFDRPIVSARRRWGVTEGLTVGALLDADLHLQVAGGELVLATRLGTFSLDLDASHDSAAGVDVATRARYDLVRPGDAPSSLGAIVVHRGRGFRDLGASGAPLAAEELVLAASRRLFGRTFVRAGARYDVWRDRGSSGEASLALSQPFAGLGVDTSFSIRAGAATATEVRALISLRWSLPADGVTLRASSRVSRNDGMGWQLGYSQTASTPSGGLAASTTLQSDPQATTASSSLDYTSGRLSASLTGETTYDRGLDDTRQRAGVTLASALVFADGRFGWSRPVTGSFALVVADDALGDHPVGVNPSRDGSMATVDRWGPAVVPNLEAYRLGRVQVEAPELAPGTSLGPTSYLLLPGYKSGTLIRVGEPGTVVVRGQLRARGGAPLSMITGEIVALDTPAATPKILMTNRDGRFATMGLSPGRHEIRLPGAAVMIFDIPAGFVGVRSLGVLEVDAGTDREGAGTEH